MPGSDSDSSALSDAPPSSSEKPVSPPVSAAPPAKAPVVKPKTSAKAKAKGSRSASSRPSAEGSRRSSRVMSTASRSNSPEKQSATASDAIAGPPPPSSSSGPRKIKFTIKGANAPPPILEEPSEKGKKRTAKNVAEDGAGSKKAKTSHVPAVEKQVAPPVKKGSVVKRNGSRGKGDVDLGDLFGDDNEDEPVAGPSTTTISEGTASDIPAGRTKRGEKGKRPAVDEPAEAQPPAEVTAPADVRIGGKKGKKVSSQDKDVQSTTEQQDVKMEELPPPPDSTATNEMKKDKEDLPASAPAPARKTKSFAQAVAGSPAPAQASSSSNDASTPVQAKKEKRNLSAVPKIAKLSQGSSTSSPLSTPQTGEKKPLPPSSSLKRPVPAQPPKRPVPAPSLLESTMATLQASHASNSTPKKEETTSTAKTPKSWATGEWVLTPEQKREVEESRAEREAARAQRMRWRQNPVNLQEAKDAYRLDATMPRIFPPISGGSGLGIKTEGMASKMVAALLATPPPKR